MIKGRGKKKKKRLADNKGGNEDGKPLASSG